jgi:prefoldin subunit 2
MPEDRKCFRMIGGTLVERTVGEVIPALEETQVGVSPLRKRANSLVERYSGTTDVTIQEERRRVSKVAER